MDYNDFFQRLDGLLDEKKMDEAEQFLIDNMKKAVELEDTQAVLTVITELVGLYRVTGRHEESTMLADRAMAIAQGAGLKGQNYATIVLNAATAYRAAGNYERAKELYEQTAGELKESGCKDAYRYASLYNNISLLYSETGEYERAKAELFKALEIIRKLPDCEVEEATTYVNLSLLYIRSGEYADAENNLMKAFAIFERDKGRKYKDAHYGAALSAYGDLNLKKGEYSKAVEVYEEALSELARSYGYNNSAYRATCENCIEAYKNLADTDRTADADAIARRIGELNNKLEKLCCDAGEGVISGLVLAREYYEVYVKDMLHREFHEYETRIAAGLAGYGSECFGFDDELSRDHDFGPSVCLWVDDTVYEEIGDKLAKEYDKLPKRFFGFAARVETKNGHGRVGVIRISDFLREHIDTDKVPERDDIAAWAAISEEQAAAAVNGEIFRDDEGLITEARQQLAEFYPDRLWYAKMAEAAVKIAQYGQYNYGRCMKRQDYVAASLAYAGFMQEVIRLCFLIYREYMPYYKWSYRALTAMAERRQEPVLHRICDGLKKLSELGCHDEKRVSENIESICAELVRLLNMQSLSGSVDTYMETQGYAIMQGCENIQNSSDDGKRELIESIVSIEWEMFQETKNEGGRADCQNNYNTFTLMRRSQFMAWNEELLRSYLADLREGERSGRNLVTEKYARMMQSTAPLEYEKFKDSLEAIDDERRTIAEQVIAIQVGWLEEFVAEYPALAGQIRYIHTSEDTPYDTSAETYLRGELDTYSKDTFILYCRYVIGLYKEGKNLNKMIMENTVLQYGYKSLDDAQKRMENIQ